MEVESVGMEEVATGPHPIGQPPEETARKATFKEKVLGAQTAGFKEVRNLVKDGFMKREQVGGADYSLTVISLMTLTT